MIRTSYETIKYIDLTKQYIVIKLCRVTSWGFLDFLSKMFHKPFAFPIPVGKWRRFRNKNLYESSLSLKRTCVGFNSHILESNPSSLEFLFRCQNANIGIQTIEIPVMACPSNCIGIG